MKVGLLFVILIGTITGIFTNYMQNNSRAILASPRIGNALQGPRVDGPGLNTTDFCLDTITIWIASDPSETPIPADWKTITNWNVAVIPAVLPTANCTLLPIQEIKIGKNTGSTFGAIDENPIFSTALGLVCKVPANLSPLTYHIAVGFKEVINTDRQQAGEINLVPSIGSWEGAIGTVSTNPFISSPSFILKESCAVVFPWSYDTTSSASSTKLTPNGNATNAFTLMHLTDLHYEETAPERMTEIALWENDASVLAPNVLLLTGDIVENSKKMTSDFALAYQHLANLGLPLVITSGNHDQFMIAPWRHTFGPLFSTTQFDDLKIIGFTATLPIGSGVINWIDQQTSTRSNNGPIFVACHYPLANDYFGSGYIGVSNTIIKNNVTAYLAGHYHEDLTGSAAKLKDLVTEEDTVESISKVVETDQSTTRDYLETIHEPQVILTRSGAKSSGAIADPYLSNKGNYSGYRLFNIANNFVSNYTYDLDGNGTRDPQISVPNGRFLTCYSNDGLEWFLNSSYTTHLNAARATFIVPKATTGFHWDLTSLNCTNGAYIRSRISNSTHEWIEARVPISAMAKISLKLESKLGVI